MMPSSQRDGETSRLPVLRVDRSRRFLDLGLHEIWHYRELLYFLIWRDMKVRYKQTAVGAAWAVIQPFLMMVVFSIFLGRLVHVPSNGVPYPVFAYVALVPWALFSQALGNSSTSLVDSVNLVTKIYFPRLILPIAAAGSFLVDFAISLTVLVGMMLYYGIHPTSRIMWIPVFTLLALVAALAVGIWFAAINVKYRDVRHTLPLLIQLWLFATPVAYPASVVPQRWRVLVGLNPMAGVVEGFRWALLGSARPDRLLALSFAVTIVVLIGGLDYFKRAERTFADWI
jgi:homopolymeric O-antigen transport system permease protein